MSFGEFRDRLATRAARARVSLVPDELDALWTYYALLSRWNRTINLTALPLENFADDTLDRLIVEPIAARSHFPDGTITWIDIGSGGGSPAVPLKIARPSARLTMVEARERKAAFLREAVRHLGWSDVSVTRERFERLARQPACASAVSAITIRGVRLDAMLARSLRRALRADGRLFLFAPTPDPPALSDFQHVDTHELLPHGRSSLIVMRVARM